MLPHLYRPLSGFKHDSFSLVTGIKYFLHIRPSEFKEAMGVISSLQNKQINPTKNKDTKNNASSRLSTAFIY